MARIARFVRGVGLLTLALMAGGAGAVRAQGLALSGAGYLAAGVSRIATGELGERLSARGYPSFGQTALAVSVGAYGTLRGGVMLGGEWHGLIMGEEARDGREVGLGGGYGTLGIGYAVELSPRARLYPRLGLGGGGLGLSIERADSVAFDDVLADPEGVSEASPGIESLGRGSMVVDVGAGAELLPAGRGLLIGLRVGYLFTPFAGSWRLTDRPVRGGPAATIAGPYLRITVGAGWRRTAGDGAG